LHARISRAIASPYFRRKKRRIKEARSNNPKNQDVARNARNARKVEKKRIIRSKVVARTARLIPKGKCQG
jgi:hypothetical protein